MKSLSNFLMESQKKEIFTLNVFNVSQDEGVDDMQYGSKDYSSEKSAIANARKCAKSYKDEDDVIIVTVMAGEYEDGKGNVLGDPYDIYSISNKGKDATAKARKEAGYASETVDEYISESQKLSDEDFEYIAHQCDVEFIGYDDIDPDDKIKGRHFEGDQKGLEKVLDKLRDEGYFGYKITDIVKGDSLKMIRL